MLLEECYSGKITNRYKYYQACINQLFHLFKEAKFIWLSAYEIQQEIYVNT